jgi:SAM-dependent methyltransferase
MTDHPPGFFQGTEMPTAGWWEALWPDPSSVLDAVGLPAGGRVIDLCSGDGWFTLQIARRSNSVIAIDIDLATLERGRQRLAEQQVTNCTFQTGDAYDIAALVTEPVEFVFMANYFHGVNDRPRLAHSIHDILAPAGRLAIVNWHHRPREETVILGEPRGPRTELRISSQQTIDDVTPSDLALLKVVELPPYHYGVIFERPKFERPQFERPLR